MMRTAQGRPIFIIGGIYGGFKRCLWAKDAEGEERLVSKTRTLETLIDAPRIHLYNER